MERKCETAEYRFVSRFKNTIDATQQYAFRAPSVIRLHVSIVNRKPNGILLY